MRNNQWWLSIILLAPFIKGWVYPGWESAVEFGLASCLVAFLVYFHPGNSLDERQIKELEFKLSSLKDELGSLKLKLGFRTER